MASTELQKAGSAVNVRPETGKSEPEARGTGRVYTPRVDIAENDTALFLYADLPGVKPEDVSLTWRGEELILHARCRPRQTGRKVLHAEYGIGDFYRTFTITEEVDCNAMEATLTNGVLTVRVPKAERARPKRIPVKG